MSITRTRVGVLLAGVLALVTLLVLAVLLLLPEQETPESATPAADPLTVQPEDAEPPDCAAADEFIPRSISIEGVVDHAAVQGLPRDANNVPGVMPVHDGETFAWDLPGLRPGADQGNVLFNTHTWPNGGATGNTLLDELHVGGRIDVYGDDGRHLCYEVTERVEVLAADGYPPYYDTEGPPQLALVVCSGDRNAAGEWSHRTLWFARPVTV